MKARAFGCGLFSGRDALEARPVIASIDLKPLEKRAAQHLVTATQFKIKHDKD
jgi:hypothetical protein